MPKSKFLGTVDTSFLTQSNYGYNKTFGYYSGSYYYQYRLDLGLLASISDLIDQANQASPQEWQDHKQEFRAFQSRLREMEPQIRRIATDPVLKSQRPDLTSRASQLLSRIGDFLRVNI